MRPESRKWLEDIRSSAEFILENIAGKSREEYCADRLLRSAAERQFEIIGEAVKRLAKADPQTAERIEHFQQIVAFRNVLIHGYDLIMDERVWQTIQHDLPALLSQVQSLLDVAEGAP